MFTFQDTIYLSIHGQDISCGISKNVMVKPCVYYVYYMGKNIQYIWWYATVRLNTQSTSFQMIYSDVTPCVLVTLYGDTDLAQNWLRQWLVAWRHQAITWTNVDLSWVRSRGRHQSEGQIWTCHSIKQDWKCVFKLVSRSPRNQCVNWLKTIV